MVMFKDTLTNEEVDSDDLPVQVCMSGAGYFIGQHEPCGIVYSRLSGYFGSREETEKAMKKGWPIRDAPENKEVIAGLKKKGVLK